MNTCKVIVEYETIATGYNDNFINQEGTSHNEYTFSNEQVALAIIDLLENIKGIERNSTFIKENNDEE